MYNNIELNDILIKLGQIDYISIIRYLSEPVVATYVTAYVCKNIKLHKDFTPKNISRISLPPELTQKYSKVDIENLASKYLGEAVTEFAKVIMDRFPSKDLTNFYNNLNELKITKTNFWFPNLVFQSRVGGGYTVKNNKILVDKNNGSVSIYHELFHMASSIYKDGIDYCGFRQASLKPGRVNLGTGINEGYTQKMTERYFGYIKGVRGSCYNLLSCFADNLERIIGQEKMESLYLNANLLGLINELKNYASEEEIAKFISSTDFLYNYVIYSNIKSFPGAKEMIKSSLKTANEFLFRTYAIKLKKQLDNGMIDINELHKNLIMKCSYPFITPDDKPYQDNNRYFSPDDLKQQLEIMFPNTNIEKNTASNESISKGRLK